MSDKDKDIQARAWQLTINNPAKQNMVHEEIKKILNAVPSMIYWCMCDEIGEKGTYHTHVFFKARNALRFSTLKNKFPAAHIEKAKGTPEENRDYIRKEGEWEKSEKKETNLPETFEEWGELPQGHQGARTDLQLMYELVKEGLTNAEILEQCPDTAIKYLDKLNRLRHDYLTDRYKSTRRLDLKVNYVTGKTGAGKSRDILDEFGDENVYRVTDYQHPFDSYQLESVMVFEEFRSSLRLQDMLNYLDIYPVTLPARYSPKIGCYTTVFVVSNWTYEQQYAEIQKDREQQATYNAWVRRFNGYVKEYTDAGVIKYPTMQDYLERKDGFQPLPQNAKTPFDEQKPEENSQETFKYDEPQNIGDMPFY